MQYIPYGPALEHVPNVAVGGPGNDATVLELSHWPRNNTPERFKADSGTEIVLNYLQSVQVEASLEEASAVSSRNYSVDGLISLWAILNPKAALQQRALLVAVAECSDFDKWSGETATKITCTLNRLEIEASSPNHGRAPDSDDLERTASLYQEMLGLVPMLLDNVASFDRSWRHEYEQVVDGRELFATDQATIQEIPELDLAVFELPHTAHSVALYEQTDCSRIALVVDRHRYEVRYRYESWVELQSRHPPARIDLRPFADLLETFEGMPGEWIADDVSEPRPRFRFCGPESDISPSSVTPGLFVRLLASYLRDNASNEELQWSPETAVG